MLKTKWVRYKHSGYDCAEVIEIGGRKGRILSKLGSGFVIASISVGDGWGMFKILRKDRSKVSVEKVLIFLKEVLGEGKKSFRNNGSYDTLGIIPDSVLEEYDDHCGDADELGDWFENQMKK